MGALNLTDLSLLGSLRGVTPESFGMPFRWWDAASLNYLADDALITTGDSWDDKSPNNMNATTTTGHEPVFKSAVVGGKPAVRMQGTKRLVFNGGEVFFGDFTILCVGATANDSIFLSRAGVNRQIRVNRLDQLRASWHPESGQELVSELFTSNTTQPRMFGYRRNDYNTASRAFKFFDNATLVNPSGGAISAVLFDLDQIGIIDGGPLNIDIAELIIYNVALPDVAIQSIYNGYFKPKFSLP